MRPKTPPHPERLNLLEARLLLDEQGLFEQVEALSDKLKEQAAHIAALQRKIRTLEAHQQKSQTPSVKSIHQNAQTGVMQQPADQNTETALPKPLNHKGQAAAKQPTEQNTQVVTPSLSGQNIQIPSAKSVNQSAKTAVVQQTAEQNTQVVPPSLSGQDIQTARPSFRRRITKTKALQSKIYQLTFSLIFGQDHEQYYHAKIPCDVYKALGDAKYLTETRDVLIFLIQKYLKRPELEDALKCHYDFFHTGILINRNTMDLLVEDGRLRDILKKDMFGQIHWRREICLVSSDPSNSTSRFKRKAAQATSLFSESQKEKFVRNDSVVLTFYLKTVNADCPLYVAELPQNIRSPHVAFQDVLSKLKSQLRSLLSDKSIRIMSTDCAALQGSDSHIFITKKIFEPLLNSQSSDLQILSGKAFQLRVPKLYGRLAPSVSF